MKLLPQRRRPPVAFTILEIMLAIGIFSLAMVAIYAAWSSILRGTRIGLAAAAEVQRTRIAVRALEESVSAAVMYADNPKYYAFMADTGNDFGYLSFVSRLPESFPGSGLFKGQPIRRVTFFVDGQKNLKLSQQTLLDMSEQPYTITLAPNVSIFAMQFWNPRLGEWIPEWISTNTLPVLMRVAVNFGPESKSREDVTIRSIPLNAVAITRVGGNPQQGVPQAGAPGNRSRPIPGSSQQDDGMLQWSLRLPDNFGMNRGNVQSHPIFDGL